MHGRCLHHILAGTAVALILSVGNGGAISSAAAGQPENARDIEALVPLPDLTDFPPPTVADVGGPATGTAKVEPKPAAPAAVAPADVRAGRARPLQHALRTVA